MTYETKSQHETIALVTQLVLEALQETRLAVPVGVSNRHCHLSREDCDQLFGKGHELTWMKDLGQPGQFACKETVTIKGPKNSLQKVRVLGPLRKETQVEISVTDGFALGVKPPVSESGKLDGTPGIEMVGPEGSVEIPRGTIAALRHIHMTPETAKLYGIQDKDIVSVEFEGERGAVLRHVLVRVSDSYALEMHVDLDEANGLGIKNGDRAYVVK